MLIFLILLLIVIFIILSVYKRQVNFYISGFDSGFSFSDLKLLWKVSTLCKLDDPKSLFYSDESLKVCMEKISNIANSDNSARMQLILSKLFEYKTKLKNESDNKKTIDSTKVLSVGQKLRVILPGEGVFSSEILGNGKDLVISVPKQKNRVTIPGENWVNKVINIYLWRKGDARYVFDTTVTSQGMYVGKSSLCVKHSYNLVRSQKRKSVRAKCKIFGQLFIIKSENVDPYTVETKNGYKCLIEDISESGALIRIGGKGVQNIKIKLQFSIESRLIVMFGVVRTVEFNEEENQTLLHFECTNIDTTMKNDVLRYVYNIMPQSQKEIIQAMDEIEESEKEDETNEKHSDSEKSTDFTEVINHLDNQNQNNGISDDNTKIESKEIQEQVYEEEIETSSDAIENDILENTSSKSKETIPEEDISDDTINIFD